MSSLDPDGDSQMAASTDLSSKPMTPLGQSASFTLSELSPPNSQGVPNANGKRPLSTLDITNGDAPPASRAAGQAAGAVSGSSAAGSSDTGGSRVEVRTHEGSGYSWSKVEDEPGYMWRNKRAQEDASRAYENVIAKDRCVGNRYGDPFAMADRELAAMKAK